MDFRWSKKLGLKDEKFARKDKIDSTLTAFNSPPSPELHVSETDI